MAITSKDTAPRARFDWSLWLSRLGVILSVVSFGGIFWAINGGFSVVGLQTFAQSFNSYGAIFWAIASAWTFQLPAIPHVPATQPIIPWLGVVAASILQITLIYRKIMRLSIPRLLIGITIVLSIYDLGTTFYGLSTLAWLASAGTIVIAIIAIVITFIFEATVSYLIKEVQSWR